MEFKLKPPFNFIFIGLGILFMVYLFPLSSYANTLVYCDSEGNFTGDIEYTPFGQGTFKQEDFLFPMTSYSQTGTMSLPTNIVGSIEYHVVTSQGDFVVRSYTKTNTSTSTTGYATGLLDGFPIGSYFYVDCALIKGKTVPSSYTINTSSTALSVHENDDLISFFSEGGFYYGSYTPCNYAFNTTLSDDYDNKVLKSGSNIVFNNGNKTVHSKYFNTTSVYSKVYFNSVTSNKYRFIFSTVLDYDHVTTDWANFSYSVYDEDGTRVAYLHDDDFKELIYPFGGSSSGLYVHFFYIDFSFESESAICGYGFRAMLNTAIDHSYDSFGLYAYTGTVADLIDWYEKNWEQTQDNVNDLNNNTDGTNDTIGGINDTEGGYFDSYNSYVDSAGISAFNFDVIGNELAIASGFIGSLYSTLPSVFKYFIIGIMTIGTFALILSVGGRISKRRG